MTACDHKVAAVKRMAKAGRSSRQQAWATPLRIESSGRNLRTPSDTRTIDAAQIINESAADRRKMSVIASIATLRRIVPPTKAPACENPRPAGSFNAIKGTRPASKARAGNRRSNTIKLTFKESDARSCQINRVMDNPQHASLSYSDNSPDMSDHPRFLPRLY